MWPSHNILILSKSCSNLYLYRNKVYFLQEEEEEIELSLGNDQDYFDEEEENTARNDVENRQNTTTPSTVPNVPMRKVSLEREIGNEKRNYVFFFFLFHVHAKTFFKSSMHTVSSQDFCSLLISVISVSDFQHYITCSRIFP